MQHRPVILCVDDEENPLVLRKLVLEKAGYEVLTASSAKQAWELICSGSVDLVLSDHLMPAMTGGELAKQVKARFPDLPVVLLSGVNEIPLGYDCADAFLSKAEGPEHLCKEVAAVLNNAAMRDLESGSPHS